MGDSVDPESRTDRLARRVGVFREDQPDLVARSRELDLIQVLGRRAAEARSPSDLFATTFAALSTVEPLDFVAVAHELDDAPELLLYRGRPLGDGCVEALLATAAGLLDCTVDPIREQWCELPGFDPASARRDGLRRDEMTVLPLLRRGQPAAYVIMVPSSPSRVDRLPLWYTAVNQLTVHLDRVLGAREDDVNRFRSILDSMPQAVLVLDGHQRILQLNRAASALRHDLGLAEGVDGNAWFAHLGLEDRVEAVLEGQAEILRDEVSFRNERELNVTVTPLAGGEGPGRGLVLVLMDVGETRRLQRKLEQSERMSNLGQMISGVAHELNNPLSTILGYAQLLGTTVGDEQTNRRLKTLAEEAQRCRRIVESLLSFARRRDPERKMVPLNDVVLSVAGLMRYQLRVDDITLHTDLDPELPPLMGDRHELQQVLVNLVTNAKHAISETGRPGEIVLRTAVDPGGAIVLEVADSGTGVDESIRGKIFEPFFTSKADGQGTGLGLALVYGIVRSHGGSVNLLPDQKVGATFRVTLPPISRLAPAVERDAAPTAGTIVARILIVDDEITFARVIHEALTEDGHRVSLAEDGLTALERFRHEAFDLVICGMQIRGMDSVQLYHELMRIRPATGWRLLLTTGDAVNAEERQLRLEPGLVVLRKPFGLRSLRSAVRELLTARDQG